ncbi:T9SS type A sorting domain-containing protein [Flavobacterium sp. 25HG05S-40]|uniref:T9SS type A sorting domain-containing protein n=1 Tax=Flavobacterium sp. 25HG05S-40 TaxID=3458682 RepID=UPI0040450911
MTDNQSHFEKLYHEYKTLVYTMALPSGTTTYLSATDFNLSQVNFKIYPNPAQDFIAIQSDLMDTDLQVRLTDASGKVIQTDTILQGSTLCVVDLNTVYNGMYFVTISNGKEDKTFKILVNK